MSVPLFPKLPGDKETTDFKEVQKALTNIFRARLNSPIINHSQSAIFNFGKGEFWQVSGFQGFKEYTVFLKP